MKKRFMALTAIFVAAVFLAGCSGDDSAEQNSDQSSAESILEQQSGVVQDLEEQDQASSVRGEGEKEIPGGPMNPEEALVACSDKEEGISCSFVTENKDEVEVEISGICQTIPQSEELSCMPEMKDRPDRKSVVDES